ncbi:MAG: TrbI/VirB10 family protein [Hyphomonadaceae bacterium]|nr:TrbI/VirB10 family protein [Hyphomonadaceae bacterium]
MRLVSANDPAGTQPPGIAIRTKPPSPKRLSRKVLITGCLVFGGVVAFALVNGLSERPDRRAGEDAQSVAAASGPPESVRSASSDYAISDLPNAAELDAPRDMLWGDHPPPEANGAELAAPTDAAWSGGGASRAVRAPTEDAQALARTSPILFGVDAAHGATPLAADGRAIGGPRSAFLASQRGEGDERLSATLTPPRSANEIMAGSVIPAALVTELNSDLPGRVIAQITAPVYDSVTGGRLLIPQGARLIGTYDSANAYGDQRLLLVWNRLIMPNGWSINLQGMEGADPTGAAGLRDRTDFHLGRLAGAVVLSSIISVVANNAEDNQRTGSFAQSVGDAAAQEAARTGGRIVDRELSVRPTLRVRAGAPVRVLVTRDIRLRPYPTQ